MRIAIKIENASKVSELKTKLDWLSNESKGSIPEDISAIVVFGSHREEVPKKVAQLLIDNEKLTDVPIIISGKGREEVTEAESFKDIIERELASHGIRHYGGFYLDTEATFTSENAVNARKLLLEDLGQTPDNKLLYVNFCVLSRSGQKELEQAGLENLFTVTAVFEQKPGETQESILLGQERWIEFHYNRLTSSGN